MRVPSHADQNYFNLNSKIIFELSFLFVIDKEIVVVIILSFTHDEIFILMSLNCYHLSLYRDILYFVFRRGGLSACPIPFTSHDGIKFYDSYNYPYAPMPLFLHTEIPFEQILYGETF